MALFFSPSSCKMKVLVVNDNHYDVQSLHYDDVEDEASSRTKIKIYCHLMV